MGASSRRKGANGEREFAEILKRHGFDARRDGRLDDDLAHDVPGYHFEIKRRETLALPAWHRQAERDARGREPIVGYRRNREPWRCSIDGDRLVGLLSLEAAVRDVARRRVPPVEALALIVGRLEESLP